MEDYIEEQVEDEEELMDNELVIEDGENDGNALEEEEEEETPINEDIVDDGE